MTFTVYGDSLSGNCLKVKWLADHLGLSYRWTEVNVLKGEAKAAAFLAINPAGQVPAVRFDDGRQLAQSNAILLYLAEGTGLVPAEPFARAQMYQWLFWEQYSHEPVIAVRRFHRFYLNKPDSEIDPSLMVKGLAVLDLMERVLSEQDWFVATGFSLADIALVAYTRFAHQGGFDLSPYAHIRAWITRVEAELGLPPLA